MWKSPIREGDRVGAPPVVEILSVPEAIQRYGVCMCVVCVCVHMFGYIYLSLSLSIRVCVCLRVRACA